MSSFRTLLAPVSYPFQLNPSDKILTLGSCFAQHMGKLLAQGKWQIVDNPFGILYHPIPLAKNLTRLASSNFQFTAEDLFEHQSLWKSFAHHGSFADAQQNVALSNINAALNEGQTQLRKGGLLILTLGTAFGFFHHATEQVVANCHKVAEKEFEKRLFSVKEVVQALEEAIACIVEINKDINILLSVSPVRHIKDGLLDNQKSKATLVLACDALQSKFSNVHYCPAYELLMDDLRDYRFYEVDMVHPSPLAIQYIWTYFQTALFSKESALFYKKTAQIHRDLNHRALFPESKAHQQFLLKTIKKMEHLSQVHPHLNYQTEIEKLQSFIK